MDDDEKMREAIKCYLNENGKLIQKTSDKLVEELKKESKNIVIGIAVVRSIDRALKSLVDDNQAKGIDEFLDECLGFKVEYDGKVKTHED